MIHKEKWLQAMWTDQWMDRQTLFEGVLLSKVTYLFWKDIPVGHDTVLTDYYACPMLRSMKV